MLVVPATLLLQQAKRKLTGIMNFTNPGAISHNEVRHHAVQGAVRLQCTCVAVCSCKTEASSLVYCWWLLLSCLLRDDTSRTARDHAVL